MEIWKEVIISILISLFGGGGAAWVYLKLYVKEVARSVLNEKLEEILKNYTTKEDMQIERKELLEEVREQYLSILAFREVEKRFDENFKTIDRRLGESSKRFDKLDKALEHITDLIIQKR